MGKTTTKATASVLPVEIDGWLAGQPADPELEARREALATATARVDELRAELATVTSQREAADQKLLVANAVTRRELIAAQLKDTPDKSDRQIAEGLGVSNNTTSRIRADMVASGDVCDSHTSTDTLGRKQPRKRKARTYRYVDDTPEGEHAILAGAAQIATKRAAKRKQENAAKRAAALLLEPPQGAYRCVVIDPPWPVQTIPRVVRPNQHALDYPAMTLDEIKALALPLHVRCLAFQFGVARLPVIAF